MTKRDLYEAVGQLDAAYCRQALQSGSDGADGFMSNTKQPIWQRVTTGIVAAAACTVFVGGGVFIAQQAMQTQEGVSTQRITNFLGGSGELHVVGANMNLMYDDTSIYLYGGWYRADRNGGTVTRLTCADDAMQKMLNHVCWDGEQFYYGDGANIYRMEDTGVCEEEPFYTVSDNDIRAIETRMTEYSIRAHFVQKLANGYYAINYIADEYDDETGDYRTPDGESMQYLDFGYVYQPETGERVTTPKEGLWGMYLSDGDNIFYTPAIANGGLCKVQLDTTWTNKIETDLHMSLGDGWALADNHIYYMTTGDGLSWQYNKIDLDTHVVTTLIDDAPFMQFREYEGRLYAIENDRYLVCSNPEWTESETLFTFTDEVLAPVRQMMPETLSADQAEKSIELRRLLAVDENYALIAVNYDYDTYYALLDRQSDTVRFFCPDEQTEPDSSDVEEAPETPAEPVYAELELHTNTIPVRSIEETQALVDAARAEYKQNPRSSVIDTAPYIATFMEPTGDPQAAQEWRERINSLEYKSYLYHMMLNSKDYFETARGTMIEAIGMRDMECGEEYIEFELDQRTQRTYECTWRNDAIFKERFAGDGAEFEIGGNDKKYHGYNYRLGSDFVISDNERAYSSGSDMLFVIKRPSLIGLGFSGGACLLPQGYADYLCDFNDWDIVGTEEMLGRTCADILGTHCGNTFRIYLDVATGIMMKFERYQYNEESGDEELTDFTELRSLEVDTDFEVKRFNPDGYTPANDNVPVPNTAE